MNGTLCETYAATGSSVLLRRARLARGGSHPPQRGAAQASPPATRSRTAPKKRAVNEKAPDAPQRRPPEMPPFVLGTWRRGVAVPSASASAASAEPAPIKYSIAPNSPNSSARIVALEPPPLHPLLTPSASTRFDSTRGFPSRSRARARRRPRTPRSFPARRPPGAPRRSRRVRTSSRPGERRRIRAARGRAPSPRRSPAGAAPALRRARGRRRGNPATSSSARAGTRIGSVIGFGSVPPGERKDPTSLFRGNEKNRRRPLAPRILGKRPPLLERVLQELLPEPFDVLERFSCASQRRVEPSQDVVPPRDVRERLRESRARPERAEGVRARRPEPILRRRRHSSARNSRRRVGSASPASATATPATAARVAVR